MINLILIVDPRNLIFGNPSTLVRHKVYSESLINLAQNRFRLGVISFHSQADFVIELVDNLYLIKIPKSLIIRRRTQRRFTRKYKSLFNTHLLIAGDPWESFLSAALFSRIIASNPRIQVQAHGDIGNRVWINLNWRNRIRSYFAYFSLKSATEIRATTELQANQLTSQYGVDRDKVFVIPVPSFYFGDEIMPKLNSVRPNALGLVGRIDHDRGLDNFVELTRKLVQVNQNFSIVVVGSGHLREKLEADLRQYLRRNRILFLGNIDPVIMHKVWDKIGVLVSCAPAESYGRAMRESLVHGIPVWAIKSSGAIDLAQTAGNSMKFLDLADSAEELNSTFEHLLKQSVDVRLQKVLVESDQELIYKLVSSWVTSPVKR